MHPIRQGDESLAHQYNDILLTSPNISTVPITPAIAKMAAEFRAEHGLKAPDAIQLAAAVTHHATMFLTNDRDFPAIQGLEIIKLCELRT